MEVSKICVCGHFELSHVDYVMYLNYPNWRCDGRNEDLRHCTCEGFKQDNLRYLERLSNGRE